MKTMKFTKRHVVFMKYCGNKKTQISVFMFLPHFFIALMFSCAPLILAVCSQIALAVNSM